MSKRFNNPSSENPKVLLSLKDILRGGKKGNCADQEASESLRVKNL